MLRRLYQLHLSWENGHFEFSEWKSVIFRSDIKSVENDTFPFQKFNMTVLRAQMELLEPPQHSTYQNYA